MKGKADSLKSYNPSLIEILDCSFNPEEELLYAEYFMQNTLFVFRIKGEELYELLADYGFISSYDCGLRIVRVPAPVLGTNPVREVFQTLPLVRFMQENIRSIEVKDLIRYHLERFPDLKPPKPSLKQRIINWLIGHPCL